MDAWIDHAESRRITLLRWPLIVLVVFIHANNDRIGLFAPEEGAARITHLVRQFLSEGIAATAVPLFFLLAGRLFFRGAGLSRTDYVRKLRSRVRTLFVPYVLWNLILAAAFVIAARVPQLGSLVSGKQAAGLFEGPWEAFATVFGLGRDPIVYPFWFLRDLIVVVVLGTPLFALLYRRAAIVGLLALGVPWLLHVWPFPGFSVVGPLFFFIGGWFGWNERSPFPPARTAALLVPLWFALMAIDFLGYTGSAYPYVRHVGLGVGIAAMLALASAVEPSDRVTSRLAGAAPFAFFLYAAHEPLLTLLQRIGSRALAPLTPLSDLGIYFAAVGAVVAVCTVAQLVLSRLAPRLFAVLTGGR